jgi:hypothetical protein
MAPTVEARGLSQEALADVPDVHRTYMGGERNLTLKSVERIVKQIDQAPLALLQPRPQ